MLKCLTCHVSMEERRATTDSPYAYGLSGLKNVFLVGIAVWKCPICGVEAPVIPRTGDLHELIAKSLVEKKDALQPDEVRFLRKNSGFQANEFASLMGVSATYYSKVENGRAKLGPAVDKLARIISTSASESYKMRSMLLEIAKTLKPARKKSVISKKPVFKLERNRWLQAAA